MLRVAHAKLHRAQHRADASLRLLRAPHLWVDWFASHLRRPAAQNQSAGLESRPSIELIKLINLINLFPATRLEVGGGGAYLVRT